MSANSISFSVVIPTYNRPDDLRRCVRSIGEQSVPPEEVIIVDDGDLSESTVERLREVLPGAVGLDITRSDGPPGVSTARNTGARMATGSVVVFLDDDVELGETYLERLLELYDSHEDDRLAGIGGYDHLSPSSRVKDWYTRIFYLGQPWRINRVGMSNRRMDSNLAAKLPTKAHWLVGNNMSFKRELIVEHRFPYWNGGRETHEDLAVGWSLKTEGYYCIVDPQLSLEHHHAPEKTSDIQQWIFAGRNRIRLFRLYGRPVYAPLFAWALFGEILRHYLGALIYPNRWELARQGTGLLIGAIKQLCSGEDRPTF